MRECPYCGGSGIDSMDGGQCHHCDGTGQIGHDGYDNEREYLLDDAFYDDKEDYSDEIFE